MWTFSSRVLLRRPLVDTSLSLETALNTNTWSPVPSISREYAVELLAGVLHGHPLQRRRALNHKLDQSSSPFRRPEPGDLRLSKVLQRDLVVPLIFPAVDGMVGLKETSTRTNRSKIWLPKTMWIRVCTNFHETYYLLDFLTMKIMIHWTFWPIKVMQNSTFFLF